MTSGTAVTLEELSAYLDDYLDVGSIGDAPQALNGLQVAAEGPVTRVAAAVDASEAAILAARDAGANLLLVHHGLFWDGNVPVTGRRYRRLKTLLAADMAVYSAHLPLDVHPEVGNNVLLARELGIRQVGWFGDAGGHPLGVWGELDETVDGLRMRLEKVVGGAVKVLPGGPDRIRRVGVITGGAGSEIATAAAAGLDAFITGEGPHHTYFDAAEGGVTTYYAGHWATETWGVRALAAHLEERFGLPWTFLDLPTGL